VNGPYTLEQVKAAGVFAYNDGTPGHPTEGIIVFVPSAGTVVPGRMEHFGHVLVGPFHPDGPTHGWHHLPYCSCDLCRGDE
jgi:L-2-hydroxyglutarate oxidase LhgO